jgi:hypothetical protein
MTQPTPISEPAAPDWPDAVIALLEDQDALVRALSDLAGRQSELVERRRTDALLDLLTRRQQLIGRLTASQSALGRITGDVQALEAKVETLDEGRRRRIRALLDGIGARLAEVMAGDELDQRALASARGEGAREIAALGTAQQARSAYRGGAPGARFADRRG